MLYVKRTDPYEECENCQDLGDCKHPDVVLDNRGTTMPPDSCPRPIEIMKQTMAKYKKYKTRSE
jgi:hypothetical protein